MEVKRDSQIQSARVYPELVWTRLAIPANAGMTAFFQSCTSSHRVVFYPMLLTIPYFSLITITVVRLDIAIQRQQWHNTPFDPPKCPPIKNLRKLLMLRH